MNMNSKVATTKSLLNLNLYFSDSSLLRIFIDGILRSLRSLRMTQSEGLRMSDYKRPLLR